MIQIAVATVARRARRCAFMVVFWARCTRRRIAVAIEKPGSESRMNSGERPGHDIALACTTSLRHSKRLSKRCRLRSLRRSATSLREAASPRNSEGKFQDRTWAWTGADWAELQAAQSPGARGTIRMAHHSATKQPIIFGGTNGPEFFNDTWSLVQQP